MTGTKPHPPPGRDTEAEHQPIDGWSSVTVRGEREASEFVFWINRNGPREFATERLRDGRVLVQWR